MRLNSLKMSGFKSFVDTTQLVFQSNLTAIVGPNGCGKSNIVDAIHCVLGSTSKNLRADLIADVVFNGTDTRKPVGQAAIELIFDNSEARISGEYAQYQEVSIRRELNRDGQSNYYINGTHCRRRDVTDLFLGTGLGQNSYAIIGQGMISRLVEAKPEELRSYVEEAAGTSKYKERRRETENRIKHTRENLDRLNDIREEQTKQLNHLQRQASSAQRFKVLKQEQRLFRAQLHAILCQELVLQIASFDERIKTHENLLESKQAQLTHIDKEIEHFRTDRLEQNDIVNAIQTDYYGLGTQISRIEQQITYSKERKKQLQDDFEQLQHTHQELNEQHSEDQKQLETLKSETLTLEMSCEQTKHQAEESKEALLISEQKMQNWQHEWDEFNTSSAQILKQVEVEKTKIHHLEQKQQSLLQRIARIRDEDKQQNSEMILQEVASLKEQQTICHTRISELQFTLDSLQEKIVQQRGTYQDAMLAVEEITKILRNHQAKYASLEALQRIALGKSDTEMSQWLQAHHLENQPRLAEGITVELGWEIAVETALASHLDAICVDNFANLHESVSDIQSANVTLFNIASKPTTASQKNNLTALSDKLTSNWPTTYLLQHIYCAQDLNEALTHIDLLEPHESIMTQDGIWLSTSWLKISRQTTQKSGVLQREHEIKDVQQLISELQDKLAKQENSIKRIQEQLNLFTEERESLQNQYQTLNAKNSDYLAQIRAKEEYAIQIQLKKDSLTQEMRENDVQLLEVEKTLEESRANLITVNAQALEFKHNREQQLLFKDQLRQELEEARQQAMSHRQKSDEVHVKLENTRNQIHFLNQNIERSQRQLSNTAERASAIEKSIEEVAGPLPQLSLELQQNLEKRAVIEEQLKEAKHKLETTENNVVTFEKDRHQIEKSQIEVRDQLEEIRLSCQEQKVKRANHLEQIEEAGFILQELVDGLPQDALAGLWEENISKIENRIIRLGPINLAAIEEFAQLQERKEYLDNQYNDLTEALETLENAIRKIDRETRQRFKETYELLNQSFKAYFTEIFGGGEAFLDLTSDDLLETGVLVRAQPPGKKNTTIHLLSGGEKALTAIALVFAIFSLNPAPFCVLDEVDAPLDDANVGRFCNLVKKMAEKIQFIFISHNKIAIEMGQQLAGVTMHEPGVSRLVSVDIDQAITMATE